MDNFGRIIAILLAVVLIFLYPLQSVAAQQIAIHDNYVMEETTRFIEEVKSQGKIMQLSYEQYLERLSLSGESLQISLAVAHPVSSKDGEPAPPLRMLRNGVQVMASSHTHGDACYAGHRHSAKTDSEDGRFRFTCDHVGKNCSVEDRACYSYVPCTSCGTLHLLCYNYYIGTSNNYSYQDVASPFPTSCMNCGGRLGSMYWENHYSYSCGTERTFDQSNPSYSSDCRAVPGRLDTGSSTSPIDRDYSYGCWQWHKHDETIKGACGKYRSGYYSSTYCTSCYATLSYNGYELNSDGSLVPGSSYGGGGPHNSGCSGGSSKTDSGYNYSYTCGKRYGWLQVCGETEDTTPICDQVIISLAATVPNQEVYTGDPIITTATATYLNGTTTTVTCSSNYNADQAGMQTVTLSYGTYADTAKNKTAKTTTISVKVKARTKTCPNGHTYQLNKDGSDPGCPECVDTLVPTLSKTTVYKGDAFPLTSLKVTYQNGRVETVTTGWSHTFNTNQCGTQTVTITYKNGSCTAQITVKPNPSGLNVTANPTEVLHGSEPTYTVTVLYEDGTNKIITSGYTKEGFTRGAGTKHVTFTYIENGKTVSTTIDVVVKRNTHTCPYGHVYELDDFDKDGGCPVCYVTLEGILVAPDTMTLMPTDPFTITVTAVYLDGHTETATGWNHNYDSTKSGTQTVTVSYKNKSATVVVTIIRKLTCSICGATYDVDAAGNDPGCPACKTVVTGIAATPKRQTVNYGSELTLTVTATYRDGHKEAVTGWSSNYDPFREGEQEVTVFYSTAATEVTVTVLSDRLVTCPICSYVYDPSVYLNGCPICYSTPTGLEAYLSDGGDKVSYGGQIKADVVLVFRDGHRELVPDGWEIQNFNPYQLGPQQVTIVYQGFTAILAVEVVNSLTAVTCPNGHVYYLNDDGTDPGCPYCAIPELDVTVTYDITYTTDILQRMETDGSYPLQPGDYFSIEVIPRAESFWMQVQRLLFTPVRRTKLTYGGVL